MVLHSGGRTTMNKEVVSLFKALEKKNSYLLEFHKINMDELGRLSKGCTDNLENFYYSRELLLNAINKLDSWLSSEKLNKNLQINKTEKKKLMGIFKLKRKMVLSILDQDLTIISLVDKIKKEDTEAIAS